MTTNSLFLYKMEKTNTGKSPLKAPMKLILGISLSLKKRHSNHLPSL